MINKEKKREKKIRDLTLDEFELLINKSLHEAFAEISGDILALYSFDYLKSVEEARENFKDGKVKTFEEVFNG